VSGALRLRAPAKINWTLEVLGKRPDGYHEVRTVLQTIALCDWITLLPARELSIAPGDGGPPPDDNLAYRAAARLREAAGVRAGARIAIEKRVPLAAGLGGGSSDAAAVLRGLRALWALDVSDEELAAIAAGLGSDVPFFLRGGTALASGRGEVCAPLPDPAPQRLVIAWPDRPAPPDKTARMYAALPPGRYTDGAAAERLGERLRAGEHVRDEDLCNVFETLDERDPLERAGALGVGRPHLCGSGPAFFFLLAQDGPAAPLLEALTSMGLRAVETETLAAGEATAIEDA
jgi:4-diphosphocytidyl-2-C-methyl-D-erythritol kinase